MLPHSVDHIQEELMSINVSKLGVGIKSSTGVSIAFPDVCKVPAPPGPLGMPAPYPPYAKTATTAQAKTAGSQKVITTGYKQVSVGGRLSMSQGDEAGTLKGMASARAAAKAAETQQIKVAMNGLNARLQAMSSTDPNQWQAVLYEYSVLASALYVTMISD
jgi:hypothetical protein